MSCYILPAGTSSILNFTSVYRPPVLIGGAAPLTWPPTATPLTNGIKLPVGADTGLGTSCTADQLTSAVALMTPEVASSLVYRSLCGNGTPGAACTSSLPVATSSASFCCVPPFPAVAAAAAASASGNFPFSVETYPEVRGGATVYNCTGVSTFRIVSNDLPQTPSSGSSAASAVSATTMCWRRSNVGATTRSPQEFYRLRRLLRRVRRRVAAGMTSSGSSIGADDEESGGYGLDGISKYPLYCVVCRVKLNATAQAKQHYSGRTHARRVRLLYGPSVVAVAGTPADPALQGVKAPPVPSGEAMENDNLPLGPIISSDSRDISDGDGTDDTEHEAPHAPSSAASVRQPQRPLFPAGTVTPVSCDVYCSACAVSFNSTTQARQHYHGKSHAKRLRTIMPELLSNSSMPQVAAGGTAASENAVYICLVCNARPATGAHHSHVTLSHNPSTTNFNDRHLKRSPTDFKSMQLSSAAYCTS